MLAHFLAFKALMLAVTVLSNKVFANVRVAAGQPVRANYVVLFPDAPADLGDNRLTALQRVDSRARYRYDVRIVAVDADGLLMLADAVMSLIGKAPNVSGRSCTPVQLVPGVEEGRGRFDSVTDLHYMDLSFQFWSQPV
ncbi:hypothetical protein ACIP5T_03090 [Microbacterium sp. NPDC088619]|uniref:hypothetical protein n=1 Tax=Microbacterium sp. NPDC088619 TaxID=3364196 RepID=UPI003830C1A7